MKKYFILYQSHPNFISIDFIENKERVGGYIIPNNDDAKKFIIEHVKREGYSDIKEKKTKTIICEDDEGLHPLVYENE